MNRTCIISLYSRGMLKFHANELTFFSSDLPDMYQMPENVEVN